MTTEPPADGLPPLRLEWRDADSLAPNPANWREHPEAQTRALADVMGEVGWAGALLYNEATGRLIDGHARRDLAAGQKVPVLVGRWTEEQERKILATLDPLAGMAAANAAKLASLLHGVRTDSAAVTELLTGLVAGLDGEAVPMDPVAPPADFQEVGEDLETDHICPKCGHRWAGNHAP